MLMLKSVRVLVAGALLAPLTALAVPIQVDFTVTTHSFTQGGGLYDGHPLGTLGTGSFIVDTSVGDYSSYGSTGIPALDLSFQWLGLSFDETNAQIWYLDFVGGSLQSWGLGAAACSLSCLVSPGPDDFFALGFGASGLAAAHAEGAPGFAFGSLQWTTKSVPEPATLGLLGLGLLGAAVRRRKHAC
jgi:hypothetical protein